MKAENMDSVAIEVAIALALILFIGATLVTFFVEILSRLANARSRYLWAKIGEILAGEDDGELSIKALRYFFPWVNGGDQRPKHSSSEPASKGPTSQDLMGTEQMKALDYTKPGKKTKIAQIPGRVFATALLEIATARDAAGQPASGDDGSSLHDAVAKLREHYRGTPVGHFLASWSLAPAQTVDKFIADVGDWFDDHMMALTHAYKRNIKWVMGIVGLLVALFFNFNVISMGNALADNAEIRGAVVAFADDVTLDEQCRAVVQHTAEPVSTDPASVASPSPTPSPSPSGSPTAETPAEKCIATWAKEKGTFSSLGLEFPGQQDGYNPFEQYFNAPSLAAGIWAFIGVLITAGLFALGGPFWWDVLNVATRFRGARR